MAYRPGMLHRIWRALPAAPRRAALARATALLAPRPSQPAPLVPAQGFAIVAEFSRASGLGEGARLLAAGMAALGEPVWRIDAGPLLPGHSPDLPPPADPPPPPGVPLVVVVNPPVLPLTLLRLPRGLIGGRRIIGSWAWELSRAPENWRVGLPFVHEIWVPSRYTATAMEALPLGGRAVRVVPGPLALDPPRPSGLGRTDFALPGEAVVVLVNFNLASSFELKNPLGAIAAFRAAFGTRPDRLLVLKIGNPQHYPEDFATLRQAAGDAANIRFETRTLSRADNHALMACADIVLSLHRGEGLGLVPAEAMMLGRAVVATGYSGSMDYMDADSAALVRYRLIAADERRRGVHRARGAQWADPDIADAAAWLVRLAEDPALRARMGAAAREHAAAALGLVPLRQALSAMRAAPDTDA
ncbi:MAG: glycosyltransferase family 4 protein [Rhodospirillales bacterium]|nr:glycosyltransferase family 4 protein [Rhodospirillales bacterium]